MMYKNKNCVRTPEVKTYMVIVIDSKWYAIVTDPEKGVYNNIVAIEGMTIWIYASKYPLLQSNHGRKLKLINNLFSD